MLEISVIIPTRNRADLLPMALDALRNQSLARSRFEVIIVDDGSTDNTQAVLKRFDDLPLHVFGQNQAGIAAAKNLGIFASRSPILLFLDDDDVADQDLLATHVITHRRYPAPSVAVLGYTDLASDIAINPLMHHVTRVGCQLFAYGWMTPGMVLDYACFWGGRSSCKRSFLVEHGIFNPNFTFGCEDVELSWRLKRLGFSVVYEPVAKSTMIRKLSFRDFCSRQVRQGRAQRRFAQLYPDLEVRTYCEIDSGAAIWEQHAAHSAAYLQWVERLDHLAAVRSAARLPLEESVRAMLDREYRTSFALCRAQGIASDAPPPLAITNVASMKHSSSSSAPLSRSSLATSVRTRRRTSLLHHV
jgi:cellulose synthase/poly-beta-1,6-N-acetylglucosamine synthase-like glycosyltransferase